MCSKIPESFGPENEQFLGTYNWQFVSGIQPLIVLENPDSFCPDSGHLMCSKIPESFGQMRENHEKWGPENEQFLGTYNWQFVSAIQPLIVFENPDCFCPDSGHLMFSKMGPRK
jgi:hypothetical protein